MMFNVIQLAFTFVIRQYAHAFQICDPQYNPAFGQDQDAHILGTYEENVLLRSSLVLFVLAFSVTTLM